MICMYIYIYIYNIILYIQIQCICISLINEFDMIHLKEMVIGFTAFTVSLLEGIYLGKFDHDPSLTLFSLSPWESLVTVILGESSPFTSFMAELFR